MNTRVRGKWRRSGRSSRSIIRNQGEHRSVTFSDCEKRKDDSLNRKGKDHNLNALCQCPSLRFAIIKNSCHKRKVFKINYNSAFRYLFDLYYRRKAISRDLYDYCIKVGQSHKFGSLYD